jgi:hypothetical protein
MVNAFCLLFFVAMLIHNWNADIVLDINPFFEILICLAIPIQILGTIGAFIQLTYLNSLWKDANKNK